MEINQKIIVKNYTPEAMGKIYRIIAREEKLHYRIQAGSNVWKRHIDQAINVGSEIFLVNENMKQDITVKYENDQILLNYLS